MGEPVDDVKKSANQLIDRWGSEFTRLSKAIDKIVKDMEDLEKAKQPSPDDKARKVKLTLTRDQLCKALKECTDDFNVKLKDVKIPPKADPDLLKKLPDIVREGIKRKGIPAGKYITIVPKPDVDIKNLKFKGGTIDLKLTF
jgi:hypothetical protein